MKSPFKFLDAYTLADKLSFFGRKTEEKLLYQQLRMSSMVLLYGFSGTGKTSLVQCGLSQYYDGPDWHPFVIRKGESINESMHKALSSVLENSKTIHDLGELVYEVFITYSRPVYLIFDQFEEIFTLNTTENTTEQSDEKIVFFNSLNQLLKRNLPCKIILITREEYLGRLYEYEQYLPNLFDFKIRVEAMNAQKLRDVISGTFTHFEITTDSPGLKEQVIKNLLEGNATSQLAYLQVYLSQLWEQAYKKQYKQQEWGIIPPPVHLDRDIIDKVKDVKNVLDIYLANQEENIAGKLEIKPHEVRWILDYFVTPDGTKRPLLTSFNFENRLKDDKLFTCLKLLEDARLIRRDDKYFELAHDILATIIDNQRNAQQRLIKNLIQNISFSKSQESRLDTNMIKRYDEVKDIANFDEETALYVEKSRKVLRNRKLLIMGLQILLVLLFIGSFLLSYYAYRSKQQADEEKEKAQKALVQKDITDYEVILRRVNSILDNPDNCPDSMMVNKLFEMKRKSSSTFYKNNKLFIANVKNTIDRYQKSDCK
ncbi:ATP-binding protein [Emticicia sp. C21]|uniref:ATP-binding protein n=1 Tax=Emticicia sp. C21 TaxID=2302915 RepID=UPI000E341F37|nr:ATP-binding protein [Emticicia sp. C21]RFS17348.1 ATP-binding protein [Emticicia sp. C21]